MRLPSPDSVPGSRPGGSSSHTQLRFTRSGMLRLATTLDQQPAPRSPALRHSRLMTITACCNGKMVPGSARDGSMPLSATSSPSLWKVEREAPGSFKKRIQAFRDALNSATAGSGRDQGCRFHPVAGAGRLPETDLRPVRAAIPGQADAGRVRGGAFARTISMTCVRSGTTRPGCCRRWNANRPSRRSSHGTSAWQPTRR